MKKNAFTMIELIFVIVILGILAAIFMSIGMGLTISLAGIFSIALSKKSNGFFETKAYIFEMIGAVMIFGLGLFLFLALK